MVTNGELIKRHSGHASAKRRCASLMLRSSFSISGNVVTVLRTSVSFRAACTSAPCLPVASNCDLPEIACTRVVLPLMPRVNAIATIEAFKKLASSFAATKLARRVPGVLTTLDISSAMAAVEFKATHKQPVTICCWLAFSGCVVPKIGVATTVRSPSWAITDFFVRTVASA